MMVENTIPVLLVKDLQRSAAFYQELLGFRIDWGDPSGDQVMSMSRDGHAIMFQLGENDASSCVWIGLENDELFARLIEADVEVLQQPENRPWAYEMKVKDPDGHILWLGTEPKEA